MSFNSYENSIEAGRPVVLYTFTLGTTVWRYTSSDVDYLALDGKVWKSVAISNDAIKQSGEASSDALNITAPISIGPVQVHLVTPPPQAIQVSIGYVHRDDGNIRVCYAGEITQVNPSLIGQAQITVETTSATMRREGLRLGWQRSCPYALYDALTCKVNKASYVKHYKVIAKSGFLIQAYGASAMGRDYFTGGFISWLDPIRGNEFRGITAHFDNSLQIFGSLDDIYEGLNIDVYPGCPRTSTACKDKFNNLPNYGGIPHLPGSSPFDGNPVF